MASPRTLKKGIHSANQRYIVYVSGDTYPIRETLKKLGFTWYGIYKFWWMYEDKYSQDTDSQLARLGVDTMPYWTTKESEKAAAPAGYHPTQSPPEPIAKPVNPAVPPPVPTPQEPEYPNVTNKTDSDDRDYYYRHIPGEKYLGFKVKKDIYRTDIELDMEGKKIPLVVVMDRLFVRGRRKIPSYTFRTFYGGSKDMLYSKNFSAPGDWGTYSEDKIALEIPQLFQNLLNQKGRLYSSIQGALNLEERNPEFADFLKQLHDTWSDPEQQKLLARLPQKVLHIDNPEYAGDYPIGYQFISSLYLVTAVNHPLAPKADTLGSVEIDPTVKTFQDLLKRIDETLATDHAEMEQKYVRYLKSFPYHPAAAEKAQGEMKELADQFLYRHDPKYFKGKLIQYGFIRPNKKIHRNVSGFMPQENITYILDQEAIKDAVYRRGTNSAQQVFAAVAYQLMRYRRPEGYGWIFTHMEDLLKSIREVFKRYEIEMDDTTFYSKFTQTAKALYSDLFGGQAAQDRWERLNDFNEWFSGGGRGSSNTSTVLPDALNRFVSYAVSLGADAEQARTDPKRIYRELIKEWHPDANPPEKKDQANKIVSELSQRYNAMPTTITRASTWYRQLVLGGSR